MIHHCWGRFFKNETPNIKKLNKEVQNINFKKITIASIALLTLAFTACSSSDSKTESTKQTLTNVSYDPTRELYANYNQVFAKHWKEKTGKDVEITQSHGGSGK